MLCYHTYMNKVYSFLELPNITKEVWGHVVASRAIHHATVVCVHGDLGAGKTTLVTELAKLINIKQSLQSPTFVILKNYPLDENTYFKNFIHIDAYRLKNEPELEKLNWYEYINNPENLICIEWSENVPGCIPTEHIDIHLEHIGQETRTIEIK